MFHAFPWADEFVSLPQAVTNHAAAMPDRVAIVDGDQRPTWAELARAMDRGAAALATAGIGRGDRVALFAPLSAPAVAAFLGILRANAVAVPLSRYAAPAALAGMIADCGAKAILTDGLPDGVDLPPGCRSLPLAATSDAAPPPPPAIDRGDLFNIIYSSGTTGTPKGIQHAHGTREAIIRRMQLQGFGPAAVTMVATGIDSNTTMVALLPTLAFAGRLVLMGKFDAGGWLAQAAAERATHTMLVPVQYQRLLAHPDFDRFDLSSFQLKLCTSAPLRPELKRQLITRWPGRFVEIYGSTEGGGSCLLNANDHPGKLHTVGQPAPGAEFLILDDQGRRLPPGEIGEVVGRAATMMKGYFGRDDLTESITWRAPDGQIYFRSGDLGRFDEDGFLILLDRKKDMIISGGANIFAADLEAVLAEHADVNEVAVIGIPSEQWGETPLALVVARDGARPDPAALRDWANARLGRNQRLSGVELRDSLPRSEIGKVLKRALRAPYWDGK